MGFNQSNGISNSVNTSSVAWARLSNLSKFQIPNSCNGRNDINDLTLWYCKYLPFRMTENAF